MRFSENGYYIERYVKCANCGLLIYDEGISAQRNGPSLVFCSDWCVQWSERRQSEEGYFQLKIEQPAVADNDKKPASAMDMVTMNIIDSSMVSLCREMGILLMKTSLRTTASRTSHTTFAPRSSCRATRWWRTSAAAPGRPRG